jgi:hypothetical protein
LIKKLGTIILQKSVIITKPHEKWMFLHFRQVPV